jgi:hypothetical protein
MKQFKNDEEMDYYNDNHDDFVYEYDEEDSEETSELDFDY